MEDELNKHFEQLKASLKADMPVSEVAGIIANAPPPPPGSNGSAGFGLNGTTMLVTAATTLVAGAAIALALFTGEPELAQETNAQPATEQTQSSGSQTPAPNQATTFTTEQGTQSADETAELPTETQAQRKQAQAAASNETRPTLADAQSAQDKRPEKTPEQKNASTPSTGLARPDLLTFDSHSGLEFVINDATTAADVQQLANYINRKFADIELKAHFTSNRLSQLEVSSGENARTFDLSDFAETVFQAKFRNKQLQRFGILHAMERSGSAQASPPDSTDAPMQLMVRSTDTDETLKALESKLEEQGITANLRGTFRNGKMVTFRGTLKRKGNIVQLSTDDFELVRIVLERDDKGNITTFEMYCDDEQGSVEDADEEGSLDLELNTKEAEALRAEYVRIMAMEAEIDAQEAALEAQYQELEARSEALEAEADALEQKNDLLQARNDELHNRIWELEEQAYLLELEADINAAEERGDVIEKRTLQREYQRYMRDMAMEMREQAREQAREAREAARDARSMARDARKEARQQVRDCMR